MRVFLTCVTVALCTACGQSGAPELAAESSSATPSSTSRAATDSAAVARVRAELPAGYEVADLSGPAAPANLWGLGMDWEADPPACRMLADGDRAEGVSGWSASGPGGIVHAVAAVVPAGLVPSIDDSCALWTVSGGRTSGSVSYLPAPAIEGGSAVGLTADLTTRVEGGGETHSHAETFTAVLDDHIAYVVVVTDPGSAGPPLPSGFAADLLVETVAAIRG